MMNATAPIRYYTGIGSRDTPIEVCVAMEAFAAKMAQDGWRVRSGAAKRADSSFESGARRITGASGVEIYLPWKGFEGRSGSEYIVVTPTPALDATVERYHPAPQRLSRASYALLRRNAPQVLGLSLDTPSDFVVCWAEGSRYSGGRVCDVKGGTGHAVRIAFAHQVPVFNVAIPGVWAALDSFLGKGAADSQSSVQRARRPSTNPN